MLPIYIVQILIISVVYGFAVLNGKPFEGYSFLLGSVFALINLVLLAFIMKKILKKSVAWALSLIIFKYTILGVGLYLLVTRKIVHLPWFIGGVSSIVPTFLFYGLFVAKKYRFK